MRGAIIGIAFALFLVIIGILVFPSMTDSIHSASISEFEETFSVTTAAAGTTGICNLTEPLYNEDIKEVTEITSDNSNDFPSAYSYDEEEQDLTVRSLQANTSRNLTISYNTEDVGGFSGLGQIFDIGPTIIFLVLIGILGLAVWAGFFRGRG